MKNSVMRNVLFGALLSAVGVGVAQAAVIQVGVASTAGPWNWATGGLNSGYAYGPALQDFTSPTTINLGGALGLSAGNSLFIRYKSGLTSAFGGPPAVDQTGYVGSFFKDDTNGSSGQPFPSLYMPSYWGANSADPSNAGSYGVFLMALVGAITDSSGAVLFPFPVGVVTADPDGFGGFTQGFGFQISFAIPANGALLQLGFNDDIFADNTGSQQVCVGTSDVEVAACASAVPVPEPGTITLLGAGLLGFAAFLRRRKAKA